MPCAGFLWKLCGALISLPVWQLTTMCTRFQTCNKRPLKTESQPFKTSHSPTTRSISEAPALDTHHWHCSERQPAIPHAHARFHKHPLARGMHHPLPLRLQVLHQVERYPVVDLNIRVNDTLRCDIMTLPKQIHPTTLLIPQLDARFHKHTFKTHVIGSTAHENLRNTRHSPCKRSISLNTETHIQDSLFDGFASRRRRRRCYKAHSTGRRFVRSASRRRPKMFTKHMHSGQSSPPIFEVRTLDIQNPIYT